MVLAKFNCVVVFDWLCSFVTLSLLLQVVVILNFLIEKLVTYHHSRCWLLSLLFLRLTRCVALSLLLLYTVVVAAICLLSFCVTAGFEGWAVALEGGHEKSRRNFQAEDQWWGARGKNNKHTMNNNQDDNAEQTSVHDTHSLTSVPGNYRGCNCSFSWSGQGCDWRILLAPLGASRGPLVRFVLCCCLVVVCYWVVVGIVSELWLLLLWSVSVFLWLVAVAVALFLIALLWLGEVWAWQHTPWSLRAFLYSPWYSRKAEACLLLSVCCLFYCWLVFALV